MMLARWGSSQGLLTVHGLKRVYDKLFLPIDIALIFKYFTFLFLLKRSWVIEVKRFLRHNRCSTVIVTTQTLTTHLQNGLTPLHVAAHYDNQDVALLLLEKGASPHATAKVVQRIHQETEYVLQCLPLQMISSQERSAETMLKLMSSSVTLAPSRPPRMATPLSTLQPRRTRPRSH